LRAAPLEVESSPLPREEDDMVDDRIEQDTTIAPNEDGLLHAFVFIDHADRKVAEILTDLSHLKSDDFPRVWWAGSVVGDYLALVHVEAAERNDLGILQTFIENDLWDAGVRTRAATEVATVNKKGAKHLTPEILALVGIKTEHGRTRAVAQQLANIDARRKFKWFKGASVVTGHLDILLQLNAGSLAEAQDKVFLDEELAGVEGIAWTSTAIGDGSRGPFGESSSES
jgi:hypothetical protein